MSGSRQENNNMAVQAITPDYVGEIKDKIENFHGNQVVYAGWDRHLMFPAAFAWPVPPAMPFSDFRDQVMGEAFGIHPEWEQINWDTVVWLLDGQSFTPYINKGLAEQGIGHKSLLRFTTPELTGFQGAGV
tara:strand:- start:1517 stop:1909 length:393 start_codon:yes stop_codon:yes gene_type:complete